MQLTEPLITSCFCCGLSDKFKRLGRLDNVFIGKNTFYFPSALSEMSEILNLDTLTRR